MADLDESARFATDIVAESDKDKVRVANELSEQVIGIVPKVDSHRPVPKVNSHRPTPNVISKKIVEGK